MRSGFGSIGNINVPHAEQDHCPKFVKTVDGGTTGTAESTNPAIGAAKRYSPEDR